MIPGVVLLFRGARSRPNLSTMSKLPGTAATKAITPRTYATGGGNATASGVNFQHLGAIFGVWMLTEIPVDYRLRFGRCKTGRHADGNRSATGRRAGSRRWTTDSSRRRPRTRCLYPQIWPASSAKRLSRSCGSGASAVMELGTMAGIVRSTRRGTGSSSRSVLHASDRPPSFGARTRSSPAAWGRTPERG